MAKLAAVLFVAGVILGITALIRRIRRKTTKTLRAVYLSCFILSAAIIVAREMNRLSDILTLVSFLSVATAVLLLPVLLIKRLLKRRLKRTVVALVISASLCVASFIGAMIAVNAECFRATSIEDYEIEIQVDYDFEVADGDEPIEVITSRGLDGSSQLLNTQYKRVYDVSELPLVLEEYGATAEQCLRALEENDALNGQYRELFSDFVRRIEEKQPDADLSILCHNLKTLRVVELGRMDYLSKTLSFDSLGCYMRNENTIYIPEGTVYTEGEFGFQVLLHEFCHAARTVWEESDGERLRVQLCSEIGNTMVEECLNSVFSCSLLNYYEWDIAYQVPSNYLRIMLECMDNYEISDYINHSEQYFLKKLDEYAGYTNYAQVMWKLITLQRSDWSNDRINIPQSEYLPIYDFLCRLYYGKYITADMTEAERRSVADELIYKAFYDAPEGYKTETDRFYENLELY